MPRNGQDAPTIAHYDVLALAKDGEAGLFERPDCIEMIDAGKFWQG